MRLSASTLKLLIDTGDDDAREALETLNESSGWGAFTVCFHQDAYHIVALTRKQVEKRYVEDPLMWLGI